MSEMLGWRSSMCPREKVSGLFHPILTVFRDNLHIFNAFDPTPIRV